MNLIFEFLIILTGMVLFVLGLIFVGGYIIQRWSPLFNNLRIKETEHGFKVVYGQEYKWWLLMEERDKMLWVNEEVHGSYFSSLESAREVAKKWLLTGKNYPIYHEIEPKCKENENGN